MHESSKKEDSSIEADKKRIKDLEHMVSMIKSEIQKSIILSKDEIIKGSLGQLLV